MYIKPRFGLLKSLQWTVKVFPAMALWSGALVAAHTLLDLEWLRLPSMPVTVLGTAFSFYLGFKGSAAYERLWEARKIWGGIVNTSRTWGTYVTTLVTDWHTKGPTDQELPEVHRELVYRHLAWLAALRTQLRRPKPWEHREASNDEFRKQIGTLDTSDERLRALLAPFVGEAELEGVMTRTNRATQLVQRQGVRLTELLEEGRVEDFRHIEMVNVLEELYTLQGKCERIKNFPLPRQYATVNFWFVMLFLLLLPLALIDAFHVAELPHAFVWTTVPVSMSLGWVFYAWDMVLEYTENPFEGLVNDIPMVALSRTIEIDLREMLGETDLPPAIQPFEDSVLS